ncbi:MAG: hypothetical protein L3J03_08205 [Desulfobacterales bacterium]|nr:hypothetical protein [Desulfobacterales bacterium]
MAEKTDGRENSIDTLLASAWNRETRRTMANELRAMGLGQETIKRILRLEGRKP